jgi:hypothetical protein
MTKVLLQYRLLRPLDETLMQRIAGAHSVYGMHRIQVAPSLDQITVEYDASRLTESQVEAALHRRGIPVMRIH